MKRRTNVICGFLRSGLRTLPNNAKMNYNYANLLKDQGHLEASISYYREAIK